MLVAQLGNRNTAFGMPQDRKDLRLSVSTCLHSKSPRSSCRENSTFEAPYFRGDYCGYGFGHAGTGVLRTILITVVILMLLGRI
jgi:hypothetical protein